MTHTNVKTLFHNHTFPGHYNNSKAQKKKTFKIHISQGMENTCFFTGEHIKNINKTTAEFILLQFTELISVTNTLAESHGFLLEILLFSKSLHSALKETGSVLFSHL